MDSDSESKLISLISQLLLLPIRKNTDPEWEWELKIVPLIIKIVSLVRSMDLDSQPKPESKFMSLVTQAVSLFSIDLDSLPKPLYNLISHISQKLSSDSDQKPESDFKVMSLDEALRLKPEPEIISLIRQIFRVIISMNSELNKLFSLCPKKEGSFEQDKFHVTREVQLEDTHKWKCLLGKFEKVKLIGTENATHFHCESCNGENHGEFEKTLVEIKHPLHPKHSLQLVLNWGRETRQCYCCDEDLKRVFYYCSVCDFAMNIACANKPSVLYLPPTKWHGHTLALFPRRASLTCNVCGLADSSSPIYMCPPCDFVVHLRCINLPRVIRISRHRHRICHTPSFGEGNWSCGVCRRNIDNDYGGYSCTKDGCLYAAHSRCATQSNVWDGIDLEGEPEEIEEEEAELFVRISNGIIQHFSHDHHHLRLDENKGRDYDVNKQCQSCITPIYFGNFYSCVQCEFVLHETCANLFRKLYHPIHPHPLSLALMGGIDNVIDRAHNCSACSRLLTAGFFYKCCKEECRFQLHVQCATISEPLFHKSHKHPLLLTSKPRETRTCSVCIKILVDQTFNCIDECDGFALCFKCATLPQKVRHKHDEHILTLCYEEEISTMKYWCEACERKINPYEGFYMCDEYCCVTLHVECLIGSHLYMKHGSSFRYFGRQVGVLPNNIHMSRPICSNCEKRCSENIFYLCYGSKLCSLSCLFDFIYKSLT